MSNILKLVNNTVKHWYIPLIVGLLFSGIGIYSMLSPLNSYKTLAMIFSFSFLLSGVSEILFSLSNKKEIDNWGWTLTFGVLTFILGLLLVLNPEIPMKTLPIYIGFIVLFRSIMGISYAIELKNYGVKDWKNLLIIGILGLVLAFILIWNPLLAGMTIMFWIGIAIVAAGIFSIYLAFKLKKINEMPNKISNELKGRYQTIRQELNEEIQKHN
jgi:uncharacterized membrane protein HdeD (DUF308 family)|tara:strand:- start:426 stop:1067 length:642 start_codon:yes stop_codon:yes gene_type:complete